MIPKKSSSLWTSSKSPKQSITPSPSRYALSRPLCTVREMKAWQCAIYPPRKWGRKLAFGCTAWKWHWKLAIGCDMSETWQLGNSDPSTGKSKTACVGKPCQGSRSFIVAVLDPSEEDPVQFPAWRYLFPAACKLVQPMCWNAAVAVQCSAASGSTGGWAKILLQINESESVGSAAALLKPATVNNGSTSAQLSLCVERR